MQESIGSFVRKGTPFDRDLSHDEPVYPSLSPLERERTHPSIVTRSRNHPSPTKPYPTYLWTTPTYASYATRSKDESDRT